MAIRPCVFESDFSCHPFPISALNTPVRFVFIAASRFPMVRQNCPPANVKPIAYSTIAPPRFYRGRTGAENGSDELKDEWNWAG